MSSFDRSAFFSQTAETKEVVLPQGSLWVRPLTVAEDEKAARLPAGGRQAFLIRVSCVDADGNPVFIENDDEAIGNLSVTHVTKIQEAIAIANGWMKEENKDDEGN